MFNVTATQDAFYTDAYTDADADADADTDADAKGAKVRRNLSRRTPREGHEFTSPRLRNTRDQQGSNAWALHHDRDASPYNNKMD